MRFGPRGTVGGAYCRDVGGLQSVWLDGASDGLARIAVGPGWRTSRRGRFRGGRRTMTMDQERIPTAQQWRLSAMAKIQRVTTAERRFSASITLNSAGIANVGGGRRAQAATRDATVWRMANPCPDSKLGTHVAWMLTTCMEVGNHRAAGPHGLPRSTPSRRSGRSDSSWLSSIFTRRHSTPGSGRGRPGTRPSRQLPRRDLTQYSSGRGRSGGAQRRTRKTASELRRTLGVSSPSDSWWLAMRLRSTA